MRREGSTLEGVRLFAQKCARKINKMTEFYMIIARKIFFPIFYWGWGHLPPSPTLLEGIEGINLPHGRLKTLAALVILMSEKFHVLCGSLVEK